MPMSVTIAGAPPLVGYASVGGNAHLTPAGVAAMLSVAQTYLSASTVASSGAGANLLVRVGSHSGGWPIVPSDQAAQLAAIQGVLNAAANVVGT